MANVTANQAPLIKAQVFSEFMLEHITDGYLPDGLYRDVSDFGDGDTLFIPVLGETVIRDYVEDSAVEFDAVDSGQISLTITEYVSAASYVTDKLKQDAYKAMALEQAIPKEHIRVIKDRFESDMLATSSRQTLSNPNDINGFSHRWVAASAATNGVLSLKDFIYAKLSFDKARIPDQGRIAIVDAASEAALNVSVAAQAFTNNPQFEGIVNTGFAKGKRFIRNFYGWDTWVSDRLPTVTETITGGPTRLAGAKSVTNGRANVFMSALDDQHMPFMGAWRQPPAMEGFRNVAFKRDEYSTTARWGFALQRPEALITILTADGVFE